MKISVIVVLWILASRLGISTESWAQSCPKGRPCGHLCCP